VVKGLTERPGYAFSDWEVTEVLRLAYALAAGVEAVKLAFLQELSGWPEASVGGADRSGCAAVPDRGVAGVGAAGGS